LDNSGCHCDGVHYAFREVSARGKKRGKVVSVNGVEYVSKLRISFTGVEITSDEHPAHTTIYHKAARKEIKDVK